MADETRPCAARFTRPCAAGFTRPAAEPACPLSVQPGRRRRRGPATPPAAAAWGTASLV